MNISIYNSHRKPKYNYNISFHRSYFQTFKEKLSSRFVQVMIGLRRTGKTTLMKQLIDELITQGINRSHILFWSFDSKATLEEVMNKFQSASGVDFESQQTYVFLDEIQKLPDRQNQIKIYYDLYPKIHFIVSGSASVWVKKVESLAGRMEQHIIQPLSWIEYLQFRGLDYVLNQPGLYVSDIINYFEHFIHRQFFDTIDMPITQVKEYITQLSQKILFEDMVAYYDIRYPDVLKRLYELYMRQPGMLLDYTSIGRDLQVDSRTIQTYTHYLIENLLVSKLDQYSSNPLTKEKKLKRIYPVAPGLSYLDHCSGELFETFWVQQLGAHHFRRDGKYEVDLITNNHHTLKSYECKYRTDSKGSDTKGLKQFNKKYPEAQPHLLTQESLRDPSLIGSREYSALHLKPE